MEEDLSPFLWVGWEEGICLPGRTFPSKSVCILTCHQCQPLFCMLLPPDTGHDTSFYCWNKGERKAFLNYRKTRHSVSMSGNSPTFTSEVCSRPMNWGILNIFQWSIQKVGMSRRKASGLIKSTLSPALPSWPIPKPTTNLWVRTPITRDVIPTSPSKTEWPQGWEKKIHFDTNLLCVLENNNCNYNCYSLLNDHQAHYLIRIWKGKND